VLSNFTPEAVAALGGPEWLRQRRRDAFERFASTELPAEAEEVWRYSRIDELELDNFAPLAPSAPLSAPGTPVGIPQLVAGALEGAAATVVVDAGRVASVVLSEPARAAGLRIGSLASLDSSEETFAQVTGQVDAFVELATAFVADGLMINVPRGAVIEGPVIVLHHTAAGGAAVFPRTVVKLGEASQACVVEHHSSSDEPVLVVPVVELELGQAANLVYVSLQQLGAQTWQLGHQASRVQRDASLRSFSVALGGDYARVRTDSRLVGAGASSRLRALYFGAGHQMHDFRTLQDHDAPRTTSDLLFKGAVGDESRGVYSGLIRVRKGAAGTNAFQTNRNLVLSKGAHADSVPNLEIEDNDVRCSHASAVGPVDEEHLYYLESRGIPTEVAERLILLGFFGELLADLPVAALRQPLRQAVADKAASLDTGASPDTGASLGTEASQ
jgi:Fe-S cluster assembly protein SufD